jgi:hypothetical protein
MRDAPMRWKGPGRRSTGESFSESEVQAVWSKGIPVPGCDPAVWRKDICDSWMHRPSYGTRGKHAWEIDHVLPVACGGSDDLWNLHPLHRWNNRHKGDAHPWPAWGLGNVSNLAPDVGRPGEAPPMPSAGPGQASK